MQKIINKPKTENSDTVGKIIDFTDLHGQTTYSIYLSGT